MCTRAVFSCWRGVISSPQPPTYPRLLPQHSRPQARHSAREMCQARPRRRISLVMAARRAPMAWATWRSPLARWSSPRRRAAGCDCLLVVISSSSLALSICLGPSAGPAHAFYEAYRAELQLARDLPAAPQPAAPSLPCAARADVLLRKCGDLVRWQGGGLRCGEDRQATSSSGSAAPGEAELTAGRGIGDANAMADNEKNAVIVLDSGKHFNCRAPSWRSKARSRLRRRRARLLPRSRSSMKVDERSGSMPTTSPCSTSTYQADQWSPSPESQAELPKCQPERRPSARLARGWPPSGGFPHMASAPRRCPSTGRHRRPSSCLRSVPGLGRRSGARRPTPALLASNNLPRLHPEPWHLAVRFPRIRRVARAPNTRDARCPQRYACEVRVPALIESGLGDDRRRLPGPDRLAAVDAGDRRLVLIGTRRSLRRDPRFLRVPEMSTMQPPAGTF